MSLCAYNPDTLTCTVCGHVARRLPTFRVCCPPPPPPPPPVPPGAGHYLKKIITFVGFHSEEGCGCDDLALKMDRLGPDWCVSSVGMQEIVDHMRSQHKKRKSKLPWSDTWARWAVRSAASLARRYQSKQGATP